MTMRVRQNLARQVATAIEAAQSSGELPAFDMPEIVIEKPRDEGYGDYACPAAMQMARLARMAPIKIAEAIAANMPEVSYVSEVSVASPGFINFRLQTDFLQQQVSEILDASAPYGTLDKGAGKRAQVEFVSANPTGPLTIGRGRGGVMGDTLARAME
ncbi:MAG: arginine--tRNA ligase, partial [Chloroflexota bacterium]